MSHLIQRTVLELEVLEDRSSPTALTPASLASNQTSGANSNGAFPAQSDPYTASTTAQAASTSTTISTTPTSTNLTAGGVAVPIISPLTPAPLNVTPLGAGATPVNGSIPNGATVQSSSAGLGALSTFLPTYYLAYTQTGPTYTGGGGASGTTSASLDQTSSDGSAVADASPAEGATFSDGEWMAAVLPLLAQ